jgi:hypothetical protein
MRAVAEVCTSHARSASRMKSGWQRKEKAGKPSPFGDRSVWVFAVPTRESGERFVVVVARQSMSRKIDKPRNEQAGASEFPGKFTETYRSTAPPFDRSETSLHWHKGAPAVVNCRQTGSKGLVQRIGGHAPGLSPETTDRLTQSRSPCLSWPRPQSPPARRRC